MPNKSLSEDRRLGPRRAVDVKAMVTHSRLGLTKCRLLNISLDGASIETREFVLKKGTVVDLVLKLRAGSSKKHCRLRSKVERVDAEGATATLLFTDFDDDTYRILMDIVYESTPTQGSG